MMVGLRIPYRCLFRCLAALPLALGLALGLIGCPTPAGEGPLRVVVGDGGAQPHSQPSPAEIVEMARAEGEMWWYTSAPEAAALRFLELFRARYPFIRTQLVRAGTFELAARVDAELEAGSVQADVLHVLDPATFVTLKQRGDLLRYASPEARSIPSAYRDPDFWTGMRLITLCIAYNTSRTRKEQVPTTWEGLLSGPAPPGRIGLKDAASAGSAYALYYYLRERYGTAFWERLAARSPRIYKTAEENLQALLDGEVTLAAGMMEYACYAARAEGKPVGVVWPTDGVPYIIGPVAIIKRAPHPNAARLFVDFCLSSEGQAALTELLGSYSVRSDVPPPKGPPPLSQLSLVGPGDGWDNYALHQDRLQAEYARLFRRETD